MFEKIIEKIIDNEGGYVNDSTDSGGETYKGISRVYNPDWQGWRIIDKYKAIQNTQKSSLKDIVDSSAELTNLAKKYYENEYYNKYVKPLGIDDVVLSGYILDMSINIGNYEKIIQNAINMNTAEKIQIDGVIGDKTKQKLKEVIQDVGEARFLQSLIEYRVKHYVSIVINKPTQIKYLNGWVNRAYGGK